MVAKTPDSPQAGDRMSVRLARLKLRLPNGGRDALLQLALWGLADLLYEGVRGLVTGRADAAMANAHWIITFEQSLGIFWEPKLQSALGGSGLAMDALNWVYLNAQFSVNLLFLIAVYLLRNDIFYFVRNVFFVSMGVALLVHLALPVAPPRLFPRYGFIDTVHQYAHINQDTGAISLFVNPYAAVPSMHMCFSLIVGTAGYRLATRNWLRVLALSYPLVVLAAVVLSANHFFLDALAGALDAAFATFVAQRVMARVRPDSWAWGSRLPQPADA